MVGFPPRYVGSRQKQASRKIIILRLEIVRLFTDRTQRMYGEPERWLGLSIAEDELGGARIDVYC